MNGSPYRRLGLEKHCRRILLCLVAFLSVGFFPTPGNCDLRSNFTISRHERGSISVSAGPDMSADKLRSIHSNQNSQKKRSRDADLLILLWDLIRTRENEIDHLLDLAVCMLSAAPNFSEKTELDRTLQRARSLLRNVG